ncbi:MAG: response regulator [Ichthyobacteriaceae bacterium]|nr:response regulator [Ichthyobacteriaceae bacterium]
MIYTLSIYKLWKNFSYSKQTVVASNLGVIVLLIAEYLKNLLTIVSVSETNTIIGAILVLIINLYSVLVFSTLKISRIIVIAIFLISITSISLLSHGFFSATSIYYLLFFVIISFNLRKQTLNFVLVIISVFGIIFAEKLNFVEVLEYSSNFERDINYVVSTVITVLYIMIVFKFLFFKYKTKNIALTFKANQLETINEILIKDNFKSDFSLQTKQQLLEEISKEIIKHSNRVIDDTKSQYLSFSHFSSIKKSAFKLKSLIDDNIDFNYSTSNTTVSTNVNNLKLNVSYVQLNTVINNTINTFKLKAKSNGLKFKIVMGLKSEMFIETDLKRFIQILESLLENAIKTSAKGIITINVSLYQTSENNLLKINFAYNSLNFEEVEQTDFFNTFTQADYTITQSNGSVGLAFAKKIAKDINGYLKLINSTKVSTEFEFGLNCMPIEMLKSGSVKPPNLSNKLILIIDSDISSFLILEQILVPTNANIIHALNGKIGLDKVMNNKADLVFMDINMPMLNGYESTKKLLNQINLPIIGYSSDVLESSKIKSKESVMADYVIKPAAKQFVYRKIANSSLVN